jgi:hypothetical protein
MQVSDVPSSMQCIQLPIRTPIPACATASHFTNQTLSKHLFILITKTRKIVLWADYYLETKQPTSSLSKWVDY